jgi:hypothetical protein
MKTHGILVLVLALGWTVVSPAEEGRLRPSSPQVRRDVIAVIEGQLAAFRAQDLDKAYGYAATALRRQFTEARFIATVRQGYPEIWSNARAEYGIVEDNGVRALLTARVYDKSSASASYDYILYKDPAGWKIGGVTLHPVPKPAGAGSA